MCHDDKGRLILSDQDGGLYRITPPALGSKDPTRVESIDLDIGHAKGLVYAWGHLYAVTNPKAHKGRGLYLVKDTDGDDRFDEVTLLKKFPEEGGALGPDLTSAAGKFSPLDLLESILEPSKVVSDQYAPSVFTMENGDTVTGRVINLGSDSITVNVNMFDPNGNVGVYRQKVVSIEPSKISMMPEGLLNMLEKDEIMDLLAYVLSRGDGNHPMFQ